MAALQLDSDDFRRLFRHHAGGVVVVTLDAGAGPVGCTVTSLSSVSLSPPLVSLAIDDRASCWPHLATAGSFVANFLGHDHTDIAQRFAARGVDRFAPPVRWRRLESGEPVLDASQRWLRAEIRDRIAVGDHHLVIGEITQIDLTATQGSALVYHDGSFHGVGAHD